MANRIKGASMTVFAEDTQLDRLQSLGVSARLDSEDLKEIGNIDIVEVIDNVPTVDITCDANQYGSNKTLRKFAGKNFNWGTLAVTVTGPNQITVSSGMYFIDEMKYTLPGTSAITVSAPASAGQKRIDVVSISTTGVVTLTAGTATTGTPTAPATPAGRLKLAEVQANNGETLTYLNVLNCYDDTTVLLKDFEFSKVDFVCPVKESGDNTTSDAVTRTMYIENAYVNRYDAAFSTNGLATESWSLESDNKAWFWNTAGVIFVDRFAGTGSTSGFTLSYTPTIRPNGGKTCKVYTYNKSSGLYTEKEDGDDFSVTGTTLTMNSAPTSGEVLVVRYPTDPAGVSAADMPFFKRLPSEIEPHPGIAGGLKHGQVEIYLSDNTSDFVLRLQSVSVSCSMTREALYEIGHKRAYDRPMEFPIPITVSVEALASDLKEFARLCGKSFASGTEVSIDQFLKNLDLTIKIYREDDVLRASAPDVQRQPIKTIVITDVSVTDENIDLRVDGNATQTFSLKANTNLSITAKV